MIWGIVLALLAVVVMAVVWFEGFALGVDETSPPPLTCLEGPVMDRAELHGVIERVRDLGLTLISVQRMDHKGVKEHDGY